MFFGLDQGQAASQAAAAQRPGLTCFFCHKEGHKSFECPEKGKPNTSSSAGSRTVKKEGHFRQINVSMPSRRKRGIVRGTVNGVEAEILIDSGADLGVVPESMVPKNAYTSEKYMAEGALRGVHDVAKVSFGIADKVLERMAVVDRTGKCPPNCLFSLDVEDKEEYEWIGKVLHRLKPVEISQSVKILAVTTRAQARVEAGERSDPLAKVSSTKTSVAQQGALEEATHMEGEEAASAARTETKVVVEAGEGQSPAEESDSTMSSGETQPNQTVAASEATLTVSEEEEESVATTNKPGLNEGGGVDKEEEWEKFMRNWTPIDEGDERSSYMSEVKEDESLKVWRELADRKEKGYRWRNRILVQHRMVDWEEFGDVLVVPESYRERVMTIAHEKSGHLGTKKVLGMIRKRFMWPGMTKQISDHCHCCMACQLHNKYPPPPPRRLLWWRDRSSLSHFSPWLLI